MAYLAVELALFERLTGWPLDSQGRPRLDDKGVPINRLLIAPPLSPFLHLPSYGVRIPSFRKERSVNGRTVRPKDLDRQWQQVPVFSESLKGEEFANAWPAVSFYWMDEAFNASTYLYGDHLLEPDPGAPEAQALNRKNEVISHGPARGRYRPRPDPFDLTYMIRVWAKDATEIRLLCESIKRIFPARTALEVDLYDGSRAIYDMILEDIQNLDAGGAEVEASMEEEEEHYSKGFIYRIESYQDSSLDEETVWAETTVRSRLLEVANMQQRIIEAESGVDLMETKALL
jgi:hypothetical protein